MALDAGAAVGSLFLDTSKWTEGFDRAIAAAKNASTQIPAASSGIKSSLDNLSGSLDTNAKMSELFGTKLSGLRSQQDILKNGIRDLISKGLDPQSDAIKNLKSQYDDTTKKVKAADIATAGLATAGIAAAVALKKLSDIGKQSLEAWYVQEDAVAKMESVLRATGATAWTTSGELQAMASSIQESTTYGDEGIIGMQSVLLGFKNITSDTFDTATMAVLDMATVMKMDLVSAAQTVGKALDDPINGLDSLSRQGFRFSDEQKSMLKGMVETNRLAEAQAIILDELATTYGGASAAAAETSRGIDTQLKNAMGDVQEEIGRFMSRGMDPLKILFKDVAVEIGKVVKETNDYRDALETPAAERTIEQNIDLLARERKEIEAQLVGLETKAAYAIDAGGETQKAADAELQAAQQRLASIKQEQAYLAAAAAANARGTEAARRAAAEQAALAEQERVRREAQQAYNEEVAKAFDQTEAGKIAALQKEIDLWEKYSATAVASAPKVKVILSSLYAQMADLVSKSDDLTAEEKALAKAIDDAATAEAKLYSDRMAANAKMVDSAIEYASMTAKLSDTTIKSWRDEMAAEKAAAAAAIEASDADAEYKAKALDALEEYYDALEDKTATEKFEDNLRLAFTTAVSVADELYDNWADAQQDALDTMYDQLRAALDREQDAQDEALASRYDALSDALDTELQARLYAAGLAEAATVDQLNAELQAAIATGDAETIAEAQDAYDKAVIEEEYAAKQKALDERRAVEAATLADAQAKAEAKLEYESALATWELNKTTAVAQAAIAVAGALAAPPYFPANWPSVLTAGIMGGIQVAAVNKAKPMPAYADGGTAAGLSRINEAGGEIVNLPDGTMVIPNDISRIIAEASGTTQTISISFAGAHIDQGVNLDILAEKVSRKIAAKVR